MRRAEACHAKYYPSPLSAQRTIPEGRLSVLSWLGESVIYRAKVFQCHFLGIWNHLVLVQQEYSFCVLLHRTPYPTRLVLCGRVDQGAGEPSAA